MAPESSYLTGEWLRGQTLADFLGAPVEYPGEDGAQERALATLRSCYPGLEPVADEALREQP